MNGIYKIENKVNHKVYVGKSKDITHRWSEHKWALKNNRHINRTLQNAWNKYGESAFDFSVVEECEDDVTSEREIHYVKVYHAFVEDGGYNLTRGGDGGVGHRLSDEMKQHIGSFHKGQLISEDRKKLYSILYSGEGNPFYGKHHTYEVRKAQSDRLIARGEFKGANNVKAKPVICDGVIYDYAGACADRYGVKSCTLRSWLRGNRPMPDKFKELGLKWA